VDINYIICRNFTIGIGDIIFIDVQMFGNSEKGKYFITYLYISIDNINNT